jgi:hypothetical protein
LIQGIPVVLNKKYSRIKHPTIRDLSSVIDKTSVLAIKADFKKNCEIMSDADMEDSDGGVETDETSRGTPRRQAQIVAMQTIQTSHGLKLQRKRKRDPKVEVMSNIPTENAFDLLTDNEDIPTSPKGKKKIVTASKTAALTTDNVLISNPRLNSLKEAAKPIFVNKVTYSCLNTLLSGVDLSLSRRPTTQKAGNGFRVFPASVADKNKIVEKLKAQAIEHHTFTEPSERHNVFVLKNHYRCESDVLLKKLIDEKVPASSVKFLVNNEDNPIYMVLFPKNSVTLQQLQMQHKIVEGLKIRWDAFKPKKKKFTHCGRCQRWGHSSLNCGYASRCIKCLETHEAGACKRISKEEGKPSCVNCGQEGHPANSTACDIFKKFVKNSSSMTKQSTHQRRFTSEPAGWTQNAAKADGFRPNRSEFPSLEKSTAARRLEDIRNEGEQRESNQVSDTSWVPSQSRVKTFQSQSDEILNELNSLDLSEPMKILKNLLSELKSTNSPHVKAQILARFYGIGV